MFSGFLINFILENEHAFRCMGTENIPLSLTSIKNSEET